MTWKSSNDQKETSYRETNWNGRYKDRRRLCYAMSYYLIQCSSWRGMDISRVVLIPCNGTVIQVSLIPSGTLASQALSDVKGRTESGQRPTWQEFVCRFTCLFTGPLGRPTYLYTYLASQDIVLPLPYLLPSDLEPTRYVRYVVLHGEPCGFVLVSLLLSLLPSLSPQT